MSQGMTRNSSHLSFGICIFGNAMFVYFWGYNLGNIILSLHVLLISPLSKFLGSFGVCQFVCGKDWFFGFCFFVFFFDFFCLLSFAFCFSKSQQILSSRHRVRNSESDWATDQSPPVVPPHLPPACLSVQKSLKGVHRATWWDSKTQRPGYQTAWVQPVCNLPALLNGPCTTRSHHWAGIITYMTLLCDVSDRLGRWLVGREVSMTANWVVQLHLVWVLPPHWPSPCNLLAFGWKHPALPCLFQYLHSAPIVPRLPCYFILWL